MLEQSFSKNRLEAGCDEAGRGCLSGPVYAAAVILPEDFNHPLLNDSKKLTRTQRKHLRGIIEEAAICWAVGIVDNITIDEINILNASILAMHLALDQLPVRPHFIIIDGNRFKPYRKIPHQCIIKGDGLFTAIAAASILAKTHRDEFMEKLNREFPGYGWDKNKGYPTREHKKAIFNLGITPYHRKTFNMTEQLKINF
jgi:ribonuclease HII